MLKMLPIQTIYGRLTGLTDFRSLAAAMIEHLLMVLENITTGGTLLATKSQDNTLIVIRSSYGFVRICPTLF